MSEDKLERVQYNAILTKVADALERKKYSKSQGDVLLQNSRELERRFSEAMDAILETERMGLKVSLVNDEIKPIEVRQTKWNFCELKMKDPPVWPRLGEEKNVIEVIASRAGCTISPLKVQEEIKEVLGWAQFPHSYSEVRNKRGRYVALSDWKRLLTNEEQEERNLSVLTPVERIDVLLNGQFISGMAIDTLNGWCIAYTDFIHYFHRSYFEYPKTLIYVEKK